MTEVASISLLRNRPSIESMTPGAASLHRKMELLENCLTSGDCMGTLGCSKDFIESVLKTIYKDLTKEDIEADLVPTWKALKQQLTLSADAQAREWLENICSVCIAKIGELRNRFADLGHGQDGYTASPLTSAETDFIAQITDVMAGFLYRVHRSNPTSHLNREFKYEDHKGFNEWFDESNTEIKILNGLYSASSVLFYTDLEAYKAYLREFLDNPPESDPQDTPTEPTEMDADGTHY